MGAKRGGATPYHVSLLNKSPAGANANLDTDAQNGFGPETITIKDWNKGSYCYVVARYSETPKTMAGAVVNLYLADGRSFRYLFEHSVNNVALNSWTVFKIDTSGDDIKVSPVHNQSDINHVDNRGNCTD